MKCQACGAEIQGDASFCAKCGIKVGAAPSAESSDNSPTSRFQRPAGSPEAEEKLWEGRYSGKAMIGGWLAALAVSIGLIVLAVLVPPAMLVALALIPLIWIVMLAVLAYRKLNIHYELTSQRFVHKTGILTRRTDRIEVIDIDDVTFQQGIVERMLGVGTIVITSSDRTDPQLVLNGIDDVQRIANAMDDARRTERRKRGLHIEQV